MLQSQPNIQMQAIFDLIYPVGSLYFSTTLDTVAKVQAAFGGTWEKLPDGYAIWTASSGAGNTIAPGLPNIEGGIGNVYNASGASGVSGSIIQKSNTTTGLAPADAAVGTYRDYLDASVGNSIYGNSETVQPPAYKVYVYKRLTQGGGD